MKTLFRLITFLTIVLAAHSCARIDAEIDALKERMSALERRVGELNSEIDELGALVRQIHIGNYVTAVIKDKDSNGYLLAFSDGSSVHLDIPDELREEAPQIGVRQDDDGVWYWTLGGDWMLDGSGNRVRASSPPQQKPQFKMEGDEWFISYDGGSTWEMISSKASSSSGGLFRSVDTSDPDCVVITLSDGQQLRLPTWEAFDKLRQLVKQLNINLSSLSRIVSALQENDYLVSTSPFVEDGVPVGWLLNFSKSGLVVIYSGSGSSAPQVGVRRDTDGVYYWTLGGEWLLDEQGRKVWAEGSKGADAVTPKFKIEDGSWWVTYDSGSTWSNLGSATGEPGDSLFKDVDVSANEFVRLVMSDGFVLEVPKYVPMDIILDWPSDLVIGYEYLDIPFRIVGTGHGDTTLTVLTNGGISASYFRNPFNPDEGAINVSCNSETEEGDLVVILSNASGVSVVHSARFSPRNIGFALENENSYWNFLDGPFDVNLPSEGGIVNLKFYSNTDFKLDVSKYPWLRVKDFRKFGEYGTVTIEADASGGSYRHARVDLDFTDDSWAGRRDIFGAKFVIDFRQAGNSLKLPVHSIYSAYSPKEFELEVWSPSDNLTVGSSNEWISCSIVRASAEKYRLFVNLSVNTSGQMREGSVEIYDMGQHTSSVSVSQTGLAEGGNPQDIVFTVVASPENDYTVCLPFAGNLYLEIDWGDSKRTLLARDAWDYPAVHKYQSGYGPTSYQIRASGRFDALTADESVCKYMTIVSVDQWGDAHSLNDMTNAFRGSTTLRSVAPDTFHQFSQTKSFSGAFEGCTNLEYVPDNFFEGSFSCTDFSRTFYGVDKVKGESPFNMFEGRKVHLYERDGSQSPYPGYLYPRPVRFEGCFHGGQWADQEAIHAAGWD